MNNKSFTQEAKDNIKELYFGFVKWLDEHDSQSWPAFSIFIAVITIGMLFNIDAFSPVVGQVAAVGIGIFFEASIIAWKATTSRKRNDAKQNQISYWALWLSVLLALSMLVVNLFRIGGEVGFETTAYVIVGIAAAVQVIGYLIYDQANPDKTMTRDHSQNERDILRKDRHADYVIAEVRADAKIIQRIGSELNDIRMEFRNLPTDLLEPLLETARLKLLKDYANGSETVEKATRNMADVNKDGRIAKMPIAEKPRIVPLKEPNRPEIFIQDELADELPTVANEQPIDQEIQNTDF